MSTLTKTITTLNNSNVANGSLRLTFDVVQNVLANTSTVKLTLVEFMASANTGTYYLDGIISINGTAQITYENSGYERDRCVISSLNTFVTVGTAFTAPTITVTHDSSGNGSFSLVLGPRSSTGYSYFNLFNISVSNAGAHVASGAITVDLPQIADTLATATPISPINTLEDGSSPLTFRWTVSNDSGTTQTASEIQVKTGDSWEDLATISGADTEYVLAAGQLSGGTVYWRVRAYNRDDVAGSWSAAVSFVLVSAPDAPTVDCDGAPFATISWRSNGQQAYRLTVDGTLYGPFFGTVKTFSLPDYLSDGSHEVSVEIQGSYGLWSQPGTLSFTVQNVPGAAVTLSGRFAIDAKLAWATAIETADFLIYRDGAQIGHTAGSSFTDRLALGKHTYTVVNRLPDGNYTESNAVSGFLWIDGLAISAFSGGGWINLPLSDKSDREQAYTRSREYSLRHVSGADLPFLEISPFSDGGGSYDCAFVCDEQAKPFLALFGKTVIVKARGGNVVVGPFASYEKRRGDFFCTYTFTVPASHYEDYVDA